MMRPNPDPTRAPDPDRTRPPRPWAARPFPAWTPPAFGGGHSEAVHSYLSYFCTLRAQRVRKGTARP
jgi:hypothetical protein